MAKFYFKDGFYIDNAPEGAVEITEQRYLELFEGQSTGKQIATGEEGQPILVDPPPSPYHELKDGEWFISDLKMAQQKAEQQAQMWESIKQKRYENSLGGVFIPSVGKWFQTGEEEKTKYLGLDKVIDQLHEINWKCADNTFVKMNRALLDEIFLTMVQTENADHINAERHRLAMLESDNPLDYDFSTGWSANYQEQHNETTDENTDEQAYRSIDE